MRIAFLFRLLVFVAWVPLCPAQVQQNGVIDDISELVSRQQVMVPAADGVGLATDVFLPVLQDHLGFSQLTVDVGPLIGTGSLPVTIPYLRLAPQGTQLFIYPNQPDPWKLPMIFTRTPYNKSDPTQGQLEALLGYAAVVQDMRGRYASQGTYLPMYSDAWAKWPYLGDTAGHGLDTTTGHTANWHEDGWESVQYLTHQLRRDMDGNGTPDSLISNGYMGMFGASALGNSQIQAAAAHRTDASQPGLRCIMPVVASGEFYQSTGHHNGVYRERIIDGWLRGQVEFYSNWGNPALDNSVLNGLHTVADYNVATPNAAAEVAIDSWTVMNQGHYPDGPGRSMMDLSAAPVDANGEGDPNGGHSRYENLQLPIYHLTGWWDIFIDGQIHTWQKQLQHVNPTWRSRQKIVIGPWAHQTIGTRATGDMRIQPGSGLDYRYPENVTSALGVAADLDNISTEQLGSLANSELIRWFRAHLGGEPQVLLPPQPQWQYVLGPMPPFLADSVYIMVPADTFQTSYIQFLNFINGADTLRQLPVRVWGIPGTDSSTVSLVDVPPLPTSILGDTANTYIQPATAFNWDTVPNVRFYVVGPVNDGISGQNGNPTTGNYWYGADTFPLPTPIVQWQKMYFHADGRFNEFAPTQDEGSRLMASDPNSPVTTHGGPNMIVRTPDNSRVSQGQMNFADPNFISFTLNRDSLFINGTRYADQMMFTSTAVLDSFSIAGFPIVTLYASSQPLGGGPMDSTNVDFMVRVLDVYPDGREMYVFEGAVNARARAYAAAWTDGVEDVNVAFTNIVPGQVYEYTFNMLPIAYTWGKGHRIKVLISNSNYPRFQPNHHLPLVPRTFFRRRPFEQKAYDYFGQTLYPRSSLNTVQFSDVFAGNINFPVLGAQFLSSRPETSNTASLSLSVYPNPASSRLNVASEGAGPFHYQMLDLTGRNVLSGSSSFARFSVPLDGLPAGVYVVRVANALGQAGSQRVVVH
jgi:predicted acyl esterase